MGHIGVAILVGVVVLDVVDPEATARGRLSKVSKVTGRGRVRVAIFVL